MKKKISGIITESGVINFFEILCGVAQGDSLSGLIFILALEPLLWKLTLDLGVVHPVSKTALTYPTVAMLMTSPYS